MKDYSVELAHAQNLVDLIDNGSATGVTVKSDWEPVARAFLELHAILKTNEKPNE
ncbi:hypothetical protein AB8A05_29640 [Tardiphaga sp. 538_B7_N1_4]|uniref:hypothetical protein n=1 Tax=Tardiphaga sp. 538_B7_N1_4 TaxID=3240778 RepID=UPI003F28C6CA